MKFRLQTLLSSPPLCSSLRIVSNNAVAKITVLIPIFGYWIIFNDWVAEQALLIFDEAGGPSYRLFATYFVLCFVAVGSLFYQWKCPPEINQFSDAADFVRQRCDSAGKAEETRVQSAVRSGDAISIADAARIGQDDKMLMTMPPAMGESVQDHRRDMKRDWFLYYFEMRNREHIKVRHWIRGFYVVGFAILGLQSLDIFMRVAWTLAKRIVNFSWISMALK